MVEGREEIKVGVEMWSVRRTDFEKCKIIFTLELAEPLSDIPFFTCAMDACAFGIRCGNSFGARNANAYGNHSALGIGWVIAKSY